MKIYQSEIQDGLVDALKNNSIACSAVAETYKPKTSPESVSKLKKILADSPDGDDIATAQNEDQFDLY